MPAETGQQDCIVDEDYDSLPEEASSCGSIELPNTDAIGINNDYHIHTTTDTLSADHLLSSSIALPTITFEECTTKANETLPAPVEYFDGDSNPSSTLFDGSSLGYDNVFSTEGLPISGDDSSTVFLANPDNNLESAFLYNSYEADPFNPFSVLYLCVCLEMCFWLRCLEMFRGVQRCSDVIGDVQICSEMLR